MTKIPAIRLAANGGLSAMAILLIMTAAEAEASEPAPSYVLQVAPPDPRAIWPWSERRATAEGDRLTLGPDTKICVSSVVDPRIARFFERDEGAAEMDAAAAHEIMKVMDHQGLPVLFPGQSLPRVGPPQEGHPCDATKDITLSVRLHPDEAGRAYVLDFVATQSASRWQGRVNRLAYTQAITERSAGGACIGCLAEDLEWLAERFVWPLRAVGAR